MWYCYYPVMWSHCGPAPVKTDRAVQIQQTNQVKRNLPSIKQSIKRTTLDWLINFAHIRENCPTGIIPECMPKVTQHNGMRQYEGWTQTIRTPFLHQTIRTPFLHQTIRTPILLDDWLNDWCVLLATFSPFILKPILLVEFNFLSFWGLVLCTWVG